MHMYTHSPGSFRIFLSVCANSGVLNKNRYDNVTAISGTTLSVVTLRRARIIVCSRESKTSAVHSANGRTDDFRVTFATRQLPYTVIGWTRVAGSPCFANSLIDFARRRRNVYVRSDFRNYFFDWRTRRFHGHNPKLPSFPAIADIDRDG